MKGNEILVFDSEESSPDVAFRIRDGFNKVLDEMRQDGVKCYDDVRYVVVKASELGS